MNYHGNPCWYELGTGDLDAAAGFYRHILGWEVVDSGMEGFDYRLARSGGDMVAGLMSNVGQAESPPPNWLIYFAVDDCDRRAAAIGAAGGKVLKQPTDIPGTGRFAVVAEAGCTREAMIAEAERLFPAQGRAYANIYPAGRFALVLAARHDGPTLSSPEYVHGCIAWQGSDYRFAMRPETVGTQSWIGGALHYLVSRAAAPAARVEQLRLGGIDVHVSTEVWTIPDDAAGERVVLTCRMPACRKPGLTAVLTVRHPQQPCPVPDDGGGVRQEADTRVEILPPNVRDGLEITVSETFLGCRNYMPPGFEACAVHGGRSYHLSTFVPVDCGSSIDRIPRDVLIGLMRDARIADK